MASAHHGVVYTKKWVVDLIFDVAGYVSGVVFCQIFVGRFGVSFSPFERLFLGRFGFGQSCGLSVIA